MKIAHETIEYYEYQALFKGKKSQKGYKRYSLLASVVLPWFLRLGVSRVIGCSL